MNTSFFVWLLLGTIWGSTWLFIKLGLQDLPPFTFAGIRFVIAAIPLLFLLLVRRVPLPRSPRDWSLMIGTGFLTFTVDYGLVFWGENHIPAGLTSILFVTMPLAGLVLAHVHLPEERMTFRKVSGVLLGIGGVTLIFSRQLYVTDPLAVWGSAAIVVAAVAGAVSSVLVKAHGGHLDPTLLTSVQMITGLVPLFLIGLPLEGSPLQFRWTAMAWAALFYLALVGTALPFVLYYWLIKRIEVTRAQLLLLFSTLVAVVLGILVLHEEFGWRTGLGGAGVLGGLILATWKRRQKAPETSPLIGS